MVRRRELPYLAAVWLAAVAIAGLLSMHGLNPAVFQPGQVSSHDLHGMDTADDAGHSAIGLCVFAVLGLISLALLSSTKRRRSLRNLPHLRPPLFTRPPGLPAAGRRRLADLCVLRL